ncbi:cytosolic 5'-nucleotidase 1A-like protein, partial [Lates japonicus]
MLCRTETTVRVFSRVLEITGIDGFWYGKTLLVTFVGFNERMIPLERDYASRSDARIEVLDAEVTGRRARKVEGGVFFPKPENAVTIAVSSRVLFRTEREQKVFEQKGVEEYLRYQVEHENEPFAPGPAFPFVKALETVNARLRELYPQSEELFDIVLVTYNHAHVGIRLINTINHHNLFIERFCMTGGSSPIGYLKAWHTNLYLSADAEKVREALAEGIAAATMFMPEKLTEVSESQLRVAFDGDAVLFSDESERIFKAHGLDKFFEHERENEDTLLDH